MKNLIEKENNIFNILELFSDKNLDFVVVGGYAVSSYKHRFSIDADIVIKGEELELFQEIVKKQGFKETIDKELENLYSSRFKRFENNLASIDIMIDALASRQTDASFSFEFLSANSSKRKIIGIEKEITAKVPSKEVLIATKVHSGRLTDFRDVAALSKDVDLEKIKKFLARGSLQELNKNLKKLNQTISDPKFIDSFKGVFMEKKFDIDLDKIKEISEIVI